MKKIFFLFTFFLSASLFAQSTGTPPEETVFVTLGIDKVIKLDFPFDSRIQIGNPNIIRVDVVPQQKEIILKGLKKGKTSIDIRDVVGDIKKRFIAQVTVTNNSKTVQELRDFLGDVEGLEISIKGGRVVVEGEIVVPSDIGRIVRILDLYEDVVRLIQLSPQSQRIISRKMQDEIQKAGMKQVSVRVVNGVFWLEGVVGSRGEANLALKIAEGYLPDKLTSLAAKSQEVERVERKPIQSFISINAKAKPEPIPKLIKVIAQFVELSKDYGKVFSFEWQPVLSGTEQGQIRFGRTSQGDVTTKSNGVLSGVINNLFPKLQSAKNAGHARIIQTAMVVVKDGHQEGGKIQKTLTIPFTLGGGNNAVASSTTNGLTLDIKPRILQDENIEMGIGISINVSSGNIGNNPVSTENVINTLVVIKSGESAAIGGVVFNQSRTDYDKPATSAAAEDGATATPLFTFIRGKDYTSTKSQFVVFITPDILESASSGTADIKKKFRRRRGF